MGNSLSLNLNEQEKKYFSALKIKIDNATNYRKLFISDPKENSLPKLDTTTIEVGNLQTGEINKTCSELKKILINKNKRPEEKQIALLLVTYLKTIIKNKERIVGDKFLALMMINSLMRTKDSEFLSIVDKKLVPRLYIICVNEKKLGIMDYSNEKVKDRPAAMRFHRLLK